LHIEEGDQEGQTSLFLVIGGGGERRRRNNRNSMRNVPLTQP